MASRNEIEEWPICCLGQAQVIAPAGLRCRETPGTSGKVVRSWPAGQVLDVWARLASGWWLVQEPVTGVTGWSYSQYLANGAVL
jgi:hypothetical protein